MVHVLSLTPRPVTAPWCGGPGTLYSWETAYPGGSASGISASEHEAMRAVTEVLRERGGQGLVQKCRPGSGASERDGYAYGDVVARARVEAGTVLWTTP